MTIRFRFLVLFLLIAAIVLVSGCGGSSNNAPPPQKVALLHGKSMPSALAIKGVLEPRYAVTLFNLDPNGTGSEEDTKAVVEGINFSAYDLIIIEGGNWDDPTSADLVNSTNKSIIGMGNPGIFFFSHIVDLDFTDIVSISGINEIFLSNPASPIWSQPNQIKISGNVAAISSGNISTNIVLWNVVPAGSEGIGSEQSDPSRSYILARDDSRYFFWGIRNALTDLSDNGLKLFENTVYYMLHQ